jgi:HEAT repeat protein
MRAKLFFTLLVTLSPYPLVTISPCRAYDEIIDSPMYRLPDLPVPRIVNVYLDAKDLWLKALQRPEADMKRKAADTIALAEQRGVKGLQATVAPLLAALNQEDQHPTVRLAVARALVVLNARSAAPSLLREAQASGGELRDIVEPALALWDYKPIRAVWLGRLRDAAAPHRDLVLAIHGLGHVREKNAVDLLRGIVLSERAPGPIRLEAARALGLWRTLGLEKDAERLSTDPSARGIPARLAAAWLLQRHASAAAIRVLQHLTEDLEPSVTARAATRLLEIDAKLLVPSLDRLLASPDGKVRALAVEVLRRRPTPRHIQLLGLRLDDPHPEVRVNARRSLHELAAKNELHALVVAEGTRAVHLREWRALEQATILLTQLDRKEAAARFVELLAFDRPEVFVTAAWGLRKLNVPATLPAALRFVEAKGKQLRDFANNPDLPVAAVDHQLAQLNQLLGQRKHQPADPALRQFIPKMGSLGAYESRAAAIWALGMIHEGQTVDTLAAALQGRLNDVASIPPEGAPVRIMSAISLGRMKAKSSVTSLRKFCPAGKPSEDHVNNACGWALERITGEAMQPPETVRRIRRNWFLTPIEGAR